MAAGVSSLVFGDRVFWAHVVAMDINCGTYAINGKVVKIVKEGSCIGKAGEIIGEPEWVRDLAGRIADLTDILQGQWTQIKDKGQWRHSTGMVLTDLRWHASGFCREFNGRGEGNVLILSMRK